uniref:Ras-GEF domain-containing protein n=1 Tax=Paramoeba aestuarina TaxID=180227 RepID=A0A7S4JRN7_9EUKA
MDAMSFLRNQNTGGAAPAANEKKIIRVQLKGGPFLDDIGVKGKTKAAAITPNDTADMVYNTIKKQILKGVEPDIKPKLEKEIESYRLATGAPEGVFEVLDAWEKIYPIATTTEFYFISPKFFNKPTRDEPPPTAHKSKKNYLKEKAGRRDTKRDMKRSNSTQKVSLMSMTDRDRSQSCAELTPQALEQKDIIFLSLPSANSVEIKAATLDKLIEFLTHESYIDPRFRDNFLLTYRSFTTGLELLTRLAAKFRAQDVAVALQTKRRIRTLSVLKAWVESHFRDFEQDQQLTDNFLVFVQGEMKDLMNSAADKLLKSYEKAKKEAEEKAKKDQEEEREEREDKTVEQIQDWRKLNSKVIAEHMTLLDSRYYCSITPKECIAYFKKNEETKNVTAMVAQFNRVSEWVVTEMCSTIKLAERIEKFEKLVSIVSDLFSLQNFNGVMAILSGLNNASVRRMKATRKGASKETMKNLKEIEKVLSHEHSYSKFRQLLSTVELPAIPYLGMYMTDLVFTNDGNKDKINGMINFHKRAMLGEIINKICLFQVGYRRVIFSRNKRNIIDFLENLPSIPDSECYDLSVFVEPKDGKYEQAIEKAIKKDEKQKDRLADLKLKLRDLEKELAELRGEEYKDERGGHHISKSPTFDVFSIHSLSLDSSRHSLTSFSSSSRSPLTYFCQLQQLSFFFSPPTKSNISFKISTSVCCLCALSTSQRRRESRGLKSSRVNNNSRK